MKIQEPSDTFALAIVVSNCEPDKVEQVPYGVNYEHLLKRYMVRVLDVEGIAPIAADHFASNIIFSNREVAALEAIYTSLHEDEELS